MRGPAWPQSHAHGPSYQGELMRELLKIVAGGVVVCLGILLLLLALSIFEPLPPVDTDVAPVMVVK